MTRFSNLRYVSTDGRVAPVDPSHPDNPLTGNSATALALSDARDRAVAWEYDGVTHTLRPRYSWAALDPLADLLVLVVGSNDLAFPNNAMVINEDGSTNHQIHAPAFITASDSDGNSTRYLVERMSDVYIDDRQRLVIGLDFNHDWVARRSYNAAQQCWGEQLFIYRR